MREVRQVGRLPLNLAGPVITPLAAYASRWKDAMKYLDPHKWYEFPASVAKCPICGDAVVVGDFDEWETETGRVTETGFHIDCKSEPDEDDPDYDDWFNGHWSMPYVDWMPLEVDLYRWFDARFRLRLPTMRAADSGKAPASEPWTQPELLSVSEG